MDLRTELPKFKDFQLLPLAEITVTCTVLWVVQLYNNVTSPSICKRQTALPSTTRNSQKRENTRVRGGEGYLQNLGTRKPLIRSRNLDSLCKEPKSRVYIALFQCEVFVTPRVMGGKNLLDQSTD